MVPLWKQQLGGLLILALSAGFTAWSWHTATIDGYYYVKASMVFPAFCVLGIGMLLFPGYRDERIARGEDISHLAGLQLLTLRWWVILVVALVVGLGNYVLMRARFGG